MKINGSFGPDDGLSPDESPACEACPTTPSTSSPPEDFDPTPGRATHLLEWTVPSGEEYYWGPACESCVDYVLGGLDDKDTSTRFQVSEVSPDDSHHGSMGASITDAPKSIRMREVSEAVARGEPVPPRRPK